jgi:hypothetical protein
MKAAFADLLRALYARIGIQHRIKLHCSSVMLIIKTEAKECEGLICPSNSSFFQLPNCTVIVIQV